MDSRVKEVKSRKQMEVTEIAGKLGRSGRSNVMSFELILDTLKKKSQCFFKYSFRASLSWNNIRFLMLNRLTNFLWKTIKDFFYIAILSKKYFLHFKSKYCFGKRHHTNTVLTSQYKYIFIKNGLPIFQTKVKRIKHLEVYRIIYNYYCLL